MILTNAAKREENLAQLQAVGALLFPSYTPSQSHCRSFIHSFMRLGLLLPNGQPNEEKFKWKTIAQGAAT